jgi:hypothetical protein
MFMPGGIPGCIPGCIPARAPPGSGVGIPMPGAIPGPIPPRAIGPPAGLGICSIPGGMRPGSAMIVGTAITGFFACRIAGGDIPDPAGIGGGPP